MLSLEAVQSTGAPWWPLVSKELRELWLGNALWAALMIAVPLSGYSYIQATLLYGEASRTALKAPELARSLSPFDGILVPTWGALYLVETFLFPLIVIRTIAAEKQQGSHKLLVQLPYSTAALIAAKAAAVAAAWGLLLLPALTAVGLWRGAGGHVDASELANLALGHLLYASVVAGLALAAAAMTGSTASAAMAALAITLGCWVLDFAAAGEDGLLKSLAGMSLTSILRTFERGIFSLPAVLGSLLVGLAGAVVAGLWLHPGRTLIRKTGLSLVVTAAIAAALAGVTQVRVFRDVTEDRRNSFNPTDDAALRSLDGTLTVTVHLAPTDPRLYDLERGALGKLRRTMSRCKILYESSGSTHGLETSGDDRYGELDYEYDGRRAMSRSTSEDEILPLIFQLAESQRPASPNTVDYPGHPLVVDTHLAIVVFYWLLPAAGLGCWATSHGIWRALRFTSNQ